MVLPTVHSIDLLYYKRMFWYHNNLANKSLPEDKQISKAFSDSLTERIFAFVEEVFNTGNTFFLDELADTIRKENFAGEPINYVEIEIKKLREKVCSLGWDPRIKVKLREQKIANSYQVIHFSMDLDATIDELRNQHEEVYREVVQGSDIIDTPSPEQLSDYYNKTTPEKDEPNS